MASLPPQSCCVQTVTHEGTPKGGLELLGDLPAYVTGDRAAKRVLLFLPDVLGHEYINAQLLADSFASQGYYVIVPDLFNGDPLPPNSPDKLAAWRPKHGLAETEPNVLKAIAWIHAELKPAFVAAVGYCFGAKYAIRLLSDTTKGVAAAAIAHPSFVSLDEVAAIKGPLLIAGAETDQIYTPELREQTEAKLKEINARYFTTLFSGVVHGFAVRGDPKDPWQRAAKEKAFADFLWWFALNQDL